MSTEEGPEHAHDHAHHHDHDHGHDHAHHHDHDHPHDHAHHHDHDHGHDDHAHESDDDSSSDLSSTGDRDRDNQPTPPLPPPIAIPTPKVLDDGRVDCFPEDPLKVVKTIQKQGEGESPPVKSMVFVHYTGTLLDGNKFDSSRDRNQPFSFKLGVGQVIKGWDYGVSSMKIGEISDLEIHSDYAYGDNGSPPTIPAKATLRFNVELLSFDKEPETAEEKIAFATARKEEGNAFVKEQKWNEALHAYERGIPHVLQINSKNEELQKKRREVHDSLQSNKALCCIKLDRTEEGLLACDEVLRIDQTNAKVWYRRALLFQKRGDWPRSKYDLIQAAYNSPNDKVIRAELDKVSAYLKELEAKEKKKYSNLFERMHKLEGKEEIEKKRRDEEAAAQEKKWAEEAEKKKKAAEEAKRKRVEEKRKRKAEEAARKAREAEEKEKEAKEKEAKNAVKEGEGEEKKEGAGEEKKEGAAEEKKEANTEEKKEGEEGK